MREWQRTWPAPAKLNLFLHVIGRRPDGYHCLQTVFCFIDLADDLRFTPRDDERIELVTPVAGVDAEQNLVVRAARALWRHARETGRASPGSPADTAASLDTKSGAGRTATPALRGVDIHLAKRIPQGGGLGGGSSDAATTLIALNHLWGCGLPAERLRDIGLSLGADVPVFLHGRNCFAEGIGEQFTDIVVPEAWYLLTRPGVAVPTAEIFRAPELPRATPPVAAGQWHPGFGRNDLETVACARYPEVARHLEVLRQFGDARMTGSGACCFVALPTRAAAEAALGRLPAEFSGCVARGLATHPLASLGAALQR